MSEVEVMANLDDVKESELKLDHTEVSSNNGQMNKKSLISPESQSSTMSTGLDTAQKRPNNVHTVETEEASIKFVGNVSCNFSESDSEEEDENYSSQFTRVKQDRIGDKRVSSVKLKQDCKEHKLLHLEDDNCQEKIAENLHTMEKETSHMQTTNTFPNEKQGSQEQEAETGVETSPLKSDLHNTSEYSQSSDLDDNFDISRPSRFNPFDRDVVFEEDYFAKSPSSFETCRDYTDKLSSGFRTTRQPQSFSSASDSFSFCSPEFQDEFSFADLGLAEDHFSRPEGHFGMSTLEELEMAMENCKDLIRDAPQNSEQQKTLVRKLVQLRMKYQDYKEGPVPIQANVKLVVGHRFKVKDSRSSKHYCEKCNAVIWGMLQVWLRCTECGYHCHEKCLNQITRTCASVRVAENPTYILSICPERGLACQNYRCAECRAQISFKSEFSEPRLCDYSGNYYCELCHWNDMMIIPARVLHNWDFEPQRVCRASKQYLRLMTNKAVLRIHDVNPMLFNFVEELDDVRKLREEILVMKKYFLSCKSALESKLLLQLSSRQHCVENSDMYSLKDLMDVQSDLLLPELAKVHSSFAQHIKSDCQLCQAKGFICELCDTHEVLFPFDNIAVVCAECSYVLHRHCFVKRDNRCPRCERRNKRSEKSC